MIIYVMLLSRLIFATRRVSFPVSAKSGLRYFNKNKMELEDVRKRETVCQACKAACAGSFQKVVDLQQQGLSVYLHKDENRGPRGGAACLVLHNAGARDLARHDYCTELCESKSKCLSCREMLRRAQELLEQVKLIQQNDVIGVCEHCMRSGPNIKCRRCQYVVNKFLQEKADECDRRKQQCKLWYDKLRRLLRDMSGEAAARRHGDSVDDLFRILKSLDTSTEARQPALISSLSCCNLARGRPSQGVIGDILEKLRIGSGSETLEDYLQIIDEEKSRMMRMAESKLAHGEEHGGRERSRSFGRKSAESSSAERMGRYGDEADRGAGGRSDTAAGKSRTDVGKRPGAGRSTTSIDEDQAAGAGRSSRGVGRSSRDLGGHKDTGTMTDKKSKMSTGKLTGKHGKEYGEDEDKDEYGKEKGGRRSQDKRRDSLRKDKSSVSRSGLGSGKDRDALRSKSHEDSKMTGGKRGADGKEEKERRGGEEGKEWREGKEGKHGKGLKEGKEGKEGKHEKGWKEGAETQEGKKGKGGKDKAGGGTSLGSKETSQRKLAGKMKPGGKDKSTAASKFKSTVELSGMVTKALQQMGKGDKEAQMRIFNQQGKTKDKSYIPMDEMITRAIRDGRRESEAARQRERARQLLSVSDQFELPITITPNPPNISEYVAPEVESSGTGGERSESLLHQIMVKETQIVKIEKRHKTLPPPKSIATDVETKFTFSDDVTDIKDLLPPKEVKDSEVVDDAAAGDGRVSFSIPGGPASPPGPAAPGKRRKPGDQGDAGEVKAPSAAKSTPADTPDKASVRRGGMVYTLSNRDYIDNGYTVLPKTKIIRKMTVYKMVRVEEEACWFRRRRACAPVLYDTGELFAAVEEDNSGRWYYRNGDLAMTYVQNSESRTAQRCVVYSERGAEEGGGGTVLACFDFSGNAMVYDRQGRIRLKYNQIEGAVYDAVIGPMSKWLWNPLNRPARLDALLTDEVELDAELAALRALHDAARDLRVPDPSEDRMRAIEYDNLLRDKDAGVYRSYEIKPKVFKLNDQFSVSVQDQEHVYVTFKDGRTQARVNVGLRLVPCKVVDVESIELTSRVATRYEQTPPASDSIAHIQDLIHKAKNINKKNCQR